MIKINKLSKHFSLGSGRILKALDDVTLEINQNEILGLVGESGSGKSTLGKVLAGLHPIKSGILGAAVSVFKKAFQAEPPV